MSRNIRTARGATINMTAMAAKHEMTRAVSNVHMNARGDRLNPDGSVRMSAEEIAIAHHNNVTPPQLQPLRDTKPIQESDPVSPIPEPDEFAEPDIPNLEEQFQQEPEPICKITRSREDGTKYVEIEYDDGSIETLEINDGE